MKELLEKVVDEVFRITSRVGIQVILNVTICPDERTESDLLGAEILNDGDSDHGPN